MLQVTQHRAENAEDMLRPEASIPATIKNSQLGQSLRLAYDNLPPAQQEAMAQLIHRGLQRAELKKAAGLLKKKKGYERSEAA